MNDPRKSFNKACPSGNHLLNEPPEYIEEEYSDLEELADEEQRYEEKK